MIYRLLSPRLRRGSAAVLQVSVILVAAVFGWPFFAEFAKISLHYSYINVSVTISFSALLFAASVFFLLSWSSSIWGIYVDLLLSFGHALAVCGVLTAINIAIFQELGEISLLLASALGVISVIAYYSLVFLLFESRSFDRETFFVLTFVIVYLISATIQVTSVGVLGMVAVPLAVLGLLVLKIVVQRTVFVRLPR